jgi:hypothetical protein
LGVYDSPYRDEEVVGEITVRFFVRRFNVDEASESLKKSIQN